MEEAKGRLPQAERLVFERLGKLRKKVITLRLLEGKSLEETARACGCTTRKIERIERRWKFLCEKERDQLHMQNSSATSN